MQHKLNMVDARNSGVDAVRVGSGERRGDADEVPTRSSGTGGKMRNEEQFAGAGCNSGSKGDGGGRRGRYG